MGNFTTIKQGKYKIVQKWNWDYGHCVYILKEKIWGIFYIEIMRSDTPTDLKRKMNSYIKLVI